MFGFSSGLSPGFADGDLLTGSSGDLLCALRGERSLVSLLVIGRSPEDDLLDESPTLMTKLLHPWNPSGKNTGMGCHCLFQGIFPTQGSNLGLTHCRQILYSLTYLNYLLKGPISKYSHTGSQGFDYEFPRTQFSL